MNLFDFLLALSFGQWIGVIFLTAIVGASISGFMPITFKFVRNEKENKDGKED